MKYLSKSNKLKGFIVTKITYFITFLDNNGKLAVYIGGDIPGLYCYLEIILSPTTLTTSGQCSYRFVPLSYTKNDIATLQPVIVSLRIIQKIICECCGRIGHNADDCIIRGLKFLPPSLKRSMNQFPFMLMNELIHQENVTAILQQITSNPVLLLPKPVLSQGDLIIVPLIMVMLRFILQSLYWNLTLNMFQIQTTLQ